MRDHERDQRVERARQWRTAQIKRFTKCQRRRRQWINFADIAEWCSKEDQSIVPSKEKRTAAFNTLASDLLAGEFEENGRSRVLYLHPTTTKYRMISASLQDAIEHNYDSNDGRSQYLAHCWIPRRLFVRWLTKNRLPARPQLFEPEFETPSQPVSQRQAESPELKLASKKEISAAINAAYDTAEAAGLKPPNIKELPAAVLPRLKEKGYRASQRSIQEVGEAKEFKRRRRQPGTTIRNEQRKQQK